MQKEEWRRDCAYSKCGGSFVPLNPKGSYCSDKCRVYAAREGEHKKPNKFAFLNDVMDNPNGEALPVSPVKEKVVNPIVVKKASIARIKPNKPTFELLLGKVTAGILKSDLAAFKEEIDSSGIKDVQKRTLHEMIKFF